MERRERRRRPAPVARQGMIAGEPTDGQTPLDPDEALGLVPSHIETRGELNEWEQANIAEALDWLSRRRTGDSVLSLEFLRELHRRMFGKTWRWAGTFRATGKTLGVGKSDPGGPEEPDREYEVPGEGWSSASGRDRDAVSS